MRTLVATDFVPGEPPPRLAPDEIHLWFVPQVDIAPGDKTGPAQAGPAQRVLTLLATYLRVPAASLHIVRNAFGKPFLSGQPDATPLQFNLSHSGTSLLVGISRRQILGVDLETLGRARPWLELARRYFTATEIQALSMLPPERLREAFLALWSCKEAVLKALGRGIAFGLDRLSFALDTEGTVLQLAQIAEEAGPSEAWNLLQLLPEAGIVGALAWHGPAMTVRPIRAAQ